MTARKRAALVCWIAALALTALLGARGFSFSFSVEREVWWFKASGYLALGSLFLSLAMTPLGRLQGLLPVAGISKGSLMAFRRSFGITAATFGLLHGILVLTLYLEGSWRVLFSSAYLRAGVVGLGILLLLLATSFPRLTGHLRIRLWRELHRLSYGAVFFVAQHLVLSPFAPKARSLFFCALLVAVVGLRALPKRTGASSNS